ncbi:MAG: SDR family NAD(P)-dependent oxidoreductase [Methanobacteriaceae archaeon]|nr:SDR family NAD(P)-dependent oxidoreductase [Methanobacteriaceae archaeon]
MVLLARRKEKLDEVAEQIKDMGRKCLHIKCDVTQTDQLQNAVKATIDEFGKVDILVNDARMGDFDSVIDTTDEL